MAGSEFAKHFGHVVNEDSEDGNGAADGDSVQAASSGSSHTNMNSSSTITGTIPHQPAGVSYECGTSQNSPPKPQHKKGSKKLKRKRVDQYMSELKELLIKNDMQADMAECHGKRNWYQQWKNEICDFMAWCVVTK